MNDFIVLLLLFVQSGLMAHFAYLCSGKLPSSPLTSLNSKSQVEWKNHLKSSTVGAGANGSGPIPIVPNAGLVASGRYTVLGCSNQQQVYYSSMKNRSKTKPSNVELPTMGLAGALNHRLSLGDSMLLSGIRMCEILEYSIDIFNAQLNKLQLEEKLKKEEEDKRAQSTKKNSSSKSAEESGSGGMWGLLRWGSGSGGSTPVPAEPTSVAAAGTTITPAVEDLNSVEYLVKRNKKLGIIYYTQEQLHAMRMILLPLKVRLAMLLAEYGYCSLALEYAFNAKLLVMDIKSKKSGCHSAGGGPPVGRNGVVVQSAPNSSGKTGNSAPPSNWNPNNTSNTTTANSPTVCPFTPSQEQELDHFIDRLDGVLGLNSANGLSSLQQIQLEQQSNVSGGHKNTGLAPSKKASESSGSYWGNFMNNVMTNANIKEFVDGPSNPPPNTNAPPSSVVQGPPRERSNPQITKAPTIAGAVSASSAAPYYPVGMVPPSNVVVTNVPADPYAAISSSNSNSVAESQHNSAADEFGLSPVPTEAKGKPVPFDPYAASSSSYNNRYYSSNDAASTSRAVGASGGANTGEAPTSNGFDFGEGGRDLSHTMNKQYVPERAYGMEFSSNSGDSSVNNDDGSVRKGGDMYSEFGGGSGNRVKSHNDMPPSNAGAVGSYGSNNVSMGEPSPVQKGDMYDEFGGNMGHSPGNMGQNSRNMGYSAGIMGQNPGSMGQNAGNVGQNPGNMGVTGAVTHTTPSKSGSTGADAENRPSGTPSKSTKENLLVASVRSSIASWLYPDAKTVSEDNLGGGNEAYFDKATGKWVFPGEVCLAVYVVVFSL